MVGYLRNFLIDFCLPTSFFTKHLLGVTTLRILNRKGSSILTVIAGLAKHVRNITCSNSVFLVQKTYRFLVAGFSLGPRNCIGQRFALAETVCVLALLIRRYEVLVPVSLEEKTMEEKKRQMLAWTPGLSMAPANARVRVKGRRRSN